MNEASLEKDPNGKLPQEPGAKLDHGKAPIRRGVLEYFPRALEEVAKVSEFGAGKYAWKGWMSVPDGINRYGDAEGRHILKAALEGEYDRDSGLLHAAHEAWNALARLELILREKDMEEVESALKPIGAPSTPVTEEEEEVFKATPLEDISIALSGSVSLVNGELVRLTPL